MTKLKNKTALITGGASGIGLKMGQLLIAKGVSNLVILDIDKDALQQSKIELATSACHVICIRTDITSEIAITRALVEIKQENLAIDILINNAGVVTGKYFSEHTNQDIDKNMTVNAIAPMKLTLALLPGMLKRRSGHIINISSAASLLSNPKMAVYCASKWAMTGWSDSLRIEMEQKRTGIKVLTVTPYYIDTGMFKGVTSPIVPILKPEKVAKSIVAAIERDKIMLRTPWLIYTLPFVKGILPQRILDIFVGKFFGIYHSMDHFKGRTNDKI